MTETLHSEIRSLHVDIEETENEIHDFLSPLFVRTRKQVVMTKVVTKKKKSTRRK